MESAIVTIKWGTEFTSEHVNILFRATKAFSSKDFKFICLTDDPKGLDSNIIPLDIPQIGLTEFPKSKGAWPKICLFHPDLAERIEHVLFLDIDTIIVGNIDPFFEDPFQHLKMLSCGPRWRNFDATLPPVGATGMLSYRPKFHVNIFETFCQDPSAAYKSFEVEQQFVAAYAQKVDFFPLEWIESFKYHLRRQYLVDVFLPPLDPKPDTLMVAFHGFPRPNLVADKTKKWARFPRSGVHRPRWVLDYWLKFRDKQ